MLNLNSIEYAYWPSNVGAYDFVHINESWELMTWPASHRHYEGLLVQAYLAATGALEEF